MSALGERLQAAREERELSLAAVAEATRIPINYLTALEAESLNAFTSDLHARGFLRNYAAYLDLDPDEMLDLYDQARGNPRARKSSEAGSAIVTTGQGHALWGADLLLGVVVVALLALAGYSVYLRQNHVEVPPTPGPTPTPTATPMPIYDGTSYSMNVQLNFAEHTLDVQQRIDYTNMTSETLPLLILNVHPNHSRNTFQLHDIKVDMGDGELVQPETNLLDVRMQVDLPHPLNPEDHVAVFMEYSLNLPKINPNEEFSGGGFGYSNRAVSLGNWYPVMAPYREEEGWYGLKSFPVGDPYVTEVADYEVTINTTQDLILAGTGTETRQGNQWKYEVEQARSFAFAASDKYQVASTQVGDVSVHSYYFPDGTEAGQAVLDTAASAMELFIELYGSYPFSDYRVAETEFAGGMEFSGLTFLGSTFYDQYDGTSRTPLIPLAAHEVAHQWFYGLVGNDQLTQPWLDEAPAEYSGFLYYEHFLPEDTDWWWFYAVDQWAPTGKIDNLIYVFRDNREYMDAVYRRGAQFMRDLRAAMGDPAFFGFLQEYQRRYAYQIASSRDFFTLVQEFTTADLVPLQEEYFRQRILP